jgi:hypothetical protein
MFRLIYNWFIKTCESIYLSQSCSAREYERRAIKDRRKATRYVFDNFGKLTPQPDRRNGPNGTLR